jgi:hypothetical protein
VTSISGKPLTIAFEEIAAAKAAFHRPDPEAEGEPAEEGTGEPVLEAVIDSDATGVPADSDSDAEPGPGA